MSVKMKKMDKESTLWRTRFENCNKALTDMMEERTEKSREYDVFVLKIQKLERLCQALQSERAILYDKIKEVRTANSNISARVLGGSGAREASPPLTPVELQDLLEFQELQEVQKLQEIQKEDPVLTEGMSRLREEQAKLLEIAASLMATPSGAHDDADCEEEEPAEEPEEDPVASAFRFRSRAPVPEEDRPAPPQEDPEPAEVPLETVPAHAVKVPARQEEVPPVQREEGHRAAGPPRAEGQPGRQETPGGAGEAGEAGEAGKVPAKPQEAAIESESAPPGAIVPETSAASNVASNAASNAESSKKQPPKKKKKRSGKSAS
ncbi:Beta-taxilin [Liparis tanakae]|uniref:Beta-taxilin n=1 Tax=Liparis tanakae TaxID=230148 RepID=A0A4Z2E5X8_9TELE|nr:Beta-taxilin [Liparis tanakae]